MAELVDHVDEQDRVLGAVERDEAVRGRLLHRIAVVVCRDGAGRVLVHRRGETVRRHPGWYDTMAGGAVEVGEDYRQGAARELAEELGLRPAAPLRFVYKVISETGLSPHWLAVFEVVLDAAEAAAIEPDAREIVWWGWMTPEEIRRNADGLPFVGGEGSALWRCLEETGRLRPID
jgi:8-oxo-dGTP pyrophosphatase MutT (NUDIX family)